MSQIVTGIVIGKTFVDGPDVLTWFGLHTAGTGPLQVQACHLPPGHLPAIVLNAVSDLETGLTDLGATHDVILVSHSEAGEIASCARPRPRPAAASDRVLDLTGGRVRRLLPGGEPRLEPGERPAGVHVGGVLGQDGATT